MNHILDQQIEAYELSPLSAVKSYSQVQRAWEKSAGMSQREILMVARGAGRVEDSSKESDKSRKRRAMAGCKDDIFRSAAGYKDEASCNRRVLDGDLQFILDVMNMPASPQPSFAAGVRE